MKTLGTPSVNAYPRDPRGGRAVVQVNLRLHEETSGTICFHLSPVQARWLATQLQTAADMAEQAPPEETRAVWRSDDTKDAGGSEPEGGGR